jgi:uncharacterized membrane protein
MLLALPTIITLWLLRILFRLVSDNATPWVVALLRAFGFVDLDPWHGRLLVPLVGVVLTLLVIYLLGVLATNLVGRRLLDWIERGILKIPVVRSIYGGSRQLLDAINVGQPGAFSRVVLVEYPRAGVWTVGFVTNETPSRIPSAGGFIEGLSVFFPTTPNPTSGWLAIVPARDVRDLDLTIEEGVKLIVSGGIVAPEGEGIRLREPGTEPRVAHKPPP